MKHMYNQKELVCPYFIYNYSYSSLEVYLLLDDLLDTNKLK